MCGIVGCAGDITFSHEKAFRTLLILDVLRGEDSTGILSVGKFNNQVDVVKSVGDPFQLFDLKHYDSVMKKNHKVLLGHNRAATAGSVTRANAHPFEFEKLVGVHNGTLQGKYRLHEGHKFDVDSQALYFHIQEKGLEDALKVTEGAWALVWWDKVSKRLNFLRNKERPLYMIAVENKKVLYWASEEWMLHAALARHSIKYDKEDLIFLDEDKHFSVKVGDKGELSEYNAEDAPGTYVPSFSTGNNAWGNNGGMKKSRQNIITLPEKKDITPQHDIMYSSARGIALEIEAKVVDARGNNYFRCIDHRKPGYKIRLYHPPGNVLLSYLTSGDPLLGNMGGWAFDKLKEEHYYTVIPNSVQLLDDDVDEAVLDKLLGREAKKDEPTRPDHNGVPMIKSVWEQRYKTCSWCNKHLYFQDSVRYDENGSAYCDECQTNTEVIPFLH